MAKQIYEGMFLLDSNRYARDARGVSGQISQMIEKLGGEVLVSRLWNEQKLSYHIKGHRKGTYWLTYFRIETSQIPKLTRESQLNNDILRSLVLLVDPRLADTLIQHAASGTPAEVAAVPEAPGPDEHKPEETVADITPATAIH